MSEVKQEVTHKVEEDKNPSAVPTLGDKKRGSAFKEYQSPCVSSKKTPKLSTEKAKKEWLGVSESPLCKDLFHRFQQVDNGTQDQKAPYNICSPKSQDKVGDHISPVQYEIYSDIQKDEFQLKNDSAEKHLKQIDFPYPSNLLSKSSSSKKHTLKSIIQQENLSSEDGLKRRLFSSKPFQSDSYEKSPQIDKCSPLPPHYLHQHMPQVIYKSHKYKQASFPYLIPFCNKCNLPPILPMHPDFEIEMVPPPLPAQIPHSPTPEPDCEQLTPLATPIPKPKHRQRKPKKPQVDENGK